jgi:hypothetical protein
MDRKKFIPIIVIAAMAVVAFAGVAVFRTVQAAAPIASLANGNPTTSAFNGGPNGGMRGLGGGTSDTELATALGIDVTKLQAAYTTATSDYLAQAVTSGQITQSQADQLKANGGRFEGNFGPFQITGIDYNALLAKALGITTEQLNAGYVKAYDTAIDARVTSGNLTQAQADLMKGEYALNNNSKFQSSMQSAYTAAVNQAVTDGVITQAQADAILKNATTSNYGGFGGRGFGGGMMGGMMGGPGGGRGHGGFGGKNGTTGGNNNTPAAPTATPNGL